MRTPPTNDSENWQLVTNEPAKFQRNNRLKLKIAGKLLIILEQEIKIYPN